jgi:DNA mismatch repair protein MutS
MVKRDVIRVITPGTVTDEEMLDISKNNFLAGVYSDKNN